MLRLECRTRNSWRSCWDLGVSIYIWNFFVCFNGCTILRLDCRNAKQWREFRFWRIRTETGVSKGESHPNNAETRVSEKSEDEFRAASFFFCSTTRLDHEYWKSSVSNPQTGSFRQRCNTHAETHSCTCRQTDDMHRDASGCTHGPRACEQSKIYIRFFFCFFVFGGRMPRLALDLFSWRTWQDAVILISNAEIRVHTLKSFG